MGHSPCKAQSALAHAPWLPQSFVIDLPSCWGLKNHSSPLLLKTHQANNTPSRHHCLLLTFFFFWLYSLPSSIARYHLPSSKIQSNACVLSVGHATNMYVQAMPLTCMYKLLLLLAVTSWVPPGLEGLFISIRPDSSLLLLTTLDYLLCELVPVLPARSLNGLWSLLARPVLRSSRKNAGNEGHTLSPCGPSVSDEHFHSAFFLNSASQTIIIS